MAGTEPSLFAVSLLGLIVACIAEYLIKHPNYFKGTIKERIWLYVTRVAIALLVILMLFGFPRGVNDGTCNPGTEPGFDECE